SPDDRRAEVGVLDGPGQSQRALLSTKLLGNGLELIDLLDDAIPRVLAGGLPEASDKLNLSLGKSRIVGDAVLVLAREDTLLERGEDGQPEADLTVEVGEFALDLLALTALC